MCALDGETLVSVCSGDQLNLTCHVTPNETLLQWSVTIPGRSVSELRFISSGGNTVSVAPLIVGQTVFQFLRTSTSPLVSTIVIDNVSSSLNGTRVECSYLDGRVVSTDIINVIGNGMFDIVYAIILCHVSAIVILMSWKWLHRCHSCYTSY